MDPPSRILHNETILGYADLIDSQYIFWPKYIPEPPAIVNLADIKRKAKSGNIKLWHSCIQHLGYKNLKSIDNLNSEMHFKEAAPKELCGDFRKKN